MRGPYTALIVERNVELGDSLKSLLEHQKFSVVHVQNVSTAMQKLLSVNFDLVLSDLELSGQTGLDLLRKIRSEELECPVIIMTSYTSIKCAAQALRLGASDYILKPFSDSYLIHAVNRVINEKCIRKENTFLKRTLSDALRNKQEIIGESQSIIELKSLICKVGPCDATVLIQGESGTGKELVAQAIHNASERSKEGRFVPVNCGAIPIELMESEFFGHVKGAYTGAIDTKEGIIREAHGGTLFLDEIAELAPILQVKLLRFIQDKTVRPVGDKQSYDVDVRIIAACNRDLQQEVSAGRMREDLFYRLNVIQIAVPPLRQRGDDIELLFKYFVNFHNKKLGRKVNKFSGKLLALLKTYSWPGNIRELENSIERAIILAKGEELEVEDFKLIKLNCEHNQLVKEVGMPSDEPMSLEAYAKNVVLQYQHMYNEMQLASILGIGRKALWIRRNKWGLHRDRHEESLI